MATLLDSLFIILRVINKRKHNIASFLRGKYDKFKSLIRRKLLEVAIGEEFFE
jgi:hypothetical protein